MELWRILSGPLIMTIVTESAVALIIGVRGVRQFSVILFMNLLTNPLINLALRAVKLGTDISGAAYYLIIFIFEAIVVLAEGWMIDRFFRNRIMNPYLLSFCLNVSSFLAGILYYSMMYLYNQIFTM